MSTMARLFLTLFAAAIVLTVSAKPDKIVCYYGSWSVYRPDDGKFAVENIDPFLCTHAIYAFSGINSDGMTRFLDEWNDISLDALQRFINLKQQNPNLKTLIAIGGWNEGSDTFSQVAANATSRQNFANSSLNFMENYGFDGFDLDWEYPGQRGGSRNDKENMVLMIEALRNTFDASNGKKYLLTAAVAASGKAADISYNIPEISKHLDFINLMAYDFHGAFDGRTGQNAPLFPSSADTNREFNVDASVKAWLSRGAPAEKLVLGMAVYGRSFTVRNVKNHGLNNPASAGTKGPFTREKGMLGYNEICALQSQGGWTEKWDDEQKVPYMYKGNQWVGYDNEESIRLKAKYAIEMNLGGAMIWSIETDDFRGNYGRKFPILSTINEVLFDTSNNKDVNVSDETTTTTTTTVAPAPGRLGDCTDRGFIRDPNDCSIFYYWEKGEIRGKFDCPANLVFNTYLTACDYLYNVPDCQ